MSKARDLAAFISTGSILSDGAIELNEITGVTTSVNEINVLTGITVTTEELNYVTGVNSAVQTQLDNISVTSGTLTKSFASGETASVSLSSSVSPTAVVAVTKEVGQTGVSSKGAWDVASDASNYELYNEAPATSLTFTYWDISTASYSQSFSVAAQSTTPEDLFFKPDGTKMYIIDSGSEDVEEYNLSTAWDISTASHSQDFDIGSQETGARGLFFKTDGTKMYIIGTTGDDVNEYNLSTAWDISTASYSQSFSVASQDTAPSGIFFKPDGTKMYIAGSVGDDVNEYNLSTAWDVSTASYSQSFSVASQDTNPKAVYLKDDGLNMYVLGATGDAVYEYTLSTAWNISTASYNQTFSVAAQDTSPTGLFFKSDGAKMYIVGYDGDAVHEYDVSGPLVLGTGSFSSSDVGKRIFVDDGGEAILTAADGSYSLVSAFGASSYTSGNWSLSGLDVDATNGITLSGSSGTAQPTAQYLPALTSSAGQIDSTYWTDINSMTADDADNNGEVYYAVSTDDRTTWSIAKASDGVRDIVRNNGGTWEYNSATGVGFSLQDIAFKSDFSVASQDTTPSGVFVKPDGTKMYVAGSGSDNVNEYDIVAGNVSSASFVRSFSVSSQDTEPYGVFFKPDGTKMFVAGATSDRIHEYSLSTPWNISTASATTSVYIYAQAQNVSGLFFKPDGLKMYIADRGGQDSHEYTLSTAWDVSTASFTNTGPNTSGVVAVNFKPDGTKMYLSFLSAITTEYNLSTAWDISTATESGNTVNTFAESGNLFGAFISSDGLNLYTNSYTTDKVSQFSLEGFSAAETWNSATTNNEFAAIAQAMTVSTNQMNKAQIDGVADGSHFTLSDTLDLAIVPYLASTGTAPTSDGLSINYDAAALNKGAILGTDYDYDMPETDKVRITSLATQNLKVRIV